MKDDALDTLVHRARPGFQPRAADKARVRHALSGKLAAGGAALGVSTLAWSAWGSKLALLALAGVGAVGVVWSVTARGPELQSSPQAPVIADVRAQQPSMPASMPEPLPIAIEDLPLAASSAESPAFRDSENDPSLLAAEAALVLEARSALRNREAARVLDVLAGYDARFAKGVMRQEVYGMRILALCDLGRTSEAVKATQRFVTRWPSSPIVARLATSCAGPILEGR